MTHDFIWLNKDRQYLLLDTGTWYDASNVFAYSLGQSFLNGKIERVLPYHDYVEEFPEVRKQESRTLGDFANGLFVRTVLDGAVAYNHNAKRRTLNMDSDISD